MRRRFLLLALLGLNVILAAGWIFTALQYSHPPAPPMAEAPTGAASVRTNVLVRRQFFSWHELESADYPTYIANLRNIGCPEQTIRDIIVADVNQLFKQRLARRIPSADRRWWSNETDRQQLETARRLRAQLEGERRDLLTKLLGTNWEAPASVAASAPAQPADRLAMDGPVLGTLSPEAKQTVRDLINQAEADARKQGVGPQNPAEVVRLEKELWIKLAGVLSPQQLEEFRLRYSPNAAALRRELDGLHFFQVTPDEFRGLFHATDDLDNQLRALGNGNDPDSQDRRRNLQQQLQTAIKASLGDQRYTQYVKLQDPSYQAALAKAQAAGAPDSAAQTVYQIDQATADEQAILQANPNLSDTQKQIEMKRIELDQLKAQAQALGQDLPPEPPAPPPPPPKSLSSIAHPIGPNESLSSLSKLYGVTPQALQDANPNLNLNNLRSGDIINIPYLAPPPAPPQQ